MMNLRNLSALGAVVVVAGFAMPGIAQETTAPTARTATTKILPQETVSGVEEYTLPPYPVQPYYYTLPNNVRIAKDTSVTTNTPITDTKGKDLAAWSESIRTCLKTNPVLVRVVGDEQVPFLINKTEGSLKLNANDKPVCPNT
jgi:hypothetical protein